MYFQRVIPDLTQRAHAYDFSKKESVPYSYSYSFVKECCQVHGLLVQDSFPKCFPVLEILSIWFERALALRGKKILDYKKIGEELETLIEEKRPFQVEEEYEDA